MKLFPFGGKHLDEVWASLKLQIKGKIELNFEILDFHAPSQETSPVHVCVITDWNLHIQAAKLKEAMGRKAIDDHSRHVHTHTASWGLSIALQAKFLPDHPHPHQEINIQGIFLQDHLGTLFPRPFGQTWEDRGTLPNFKAVSMGESSTFL